MADAVERLTPEMVATPSLSTTEHVQRYEWAGPMVDGLRVLDLCCGVGYGSAIVAEHARSVVGVDISEEAIAAARELTAGSSLPVSFEQADALEVLRTNLHERYDAVICFEGIEHLPDLDEVVAGLARFAEDGGVLVVSVPNSRTFDEENPFHLTEFGFEDARELFDKLPPGRRYMQLLAEGCVMLPADTGGSGDPDPPDTARIAMTERAEIEYANNFLVAVNVPDEKLEAAFARMRFTLAPYYNRRLRSLEASAADLWHTNRRLGRQIDEIRAALEAGEPPLAALRLGRASSASTVARLARAEEQLAAARADGARLLAEQELMRRELERLGAERGTAWHRYNELRQRRAVRWALRLSRIKPGR